MAGSAAVDAVDGHGSHGRHVLDQLAADGSVVVPEVLRKYLGGLEVISRNK